VTRQRNDGTDSVRAIGAADRPHANAPSKRIERGTLHGDVVEVLREMIVQNELPPGTRIAEADLCAQFGISRTPLREAIRVLVSEGLITLLPRRGAIVATPTLEEIKGMFLALGALESVCAPLACANFTAANIQSIQREHEAMLRFHANGRMKSYYRANEAIHVAIVQAAKNSFLLQMHRSISIRIVRDRYFVAEPDEAWQRSMQEHEAMLDAIRKREGARLAELMLQHMSGAWEDFERSYLAGERKAPNVASGADD
jgi:DNA-binding GntR family transcriptional regulator